MKMLSFRKSGLLFAIFLMSIPTVFAQKDSLEKKIIDDFCKEFDKVSPDVTKANLNQQLGMIIISVIGNNKENIRKAWDLDANDMSDIEKISEKIGEKGTMDCPSFQKYVFANLDDFNDDEEEENMNQKKVTGTLQKIEGQPFAYLVLQQQNGKMEKIYWLEYFKGADELNESPKKLMNKNVTITYKEIEVYDSSRKEYVTIKVASALTR